MEASHVRSPTRDHAPPVVMAGTPITDARMNFAELLDRAEGGERTPLTRRGKAVAAIVPVADLELLRELEARVGGRKQGKRKR